MIFMTSLNTNASNYGLCNIKDYNKDHLKKNKKLLFYDPGVYELTKKKEYSRYELLHNLASGVIPLKKNEYVSIDYPSDMVKVPLKTRIISKTITEVLNHENDEGERIQIPPFTFYDIEEYEDYDDPKYLRQCEDFVGKTIDNNINYADNLHYICTIQYKWKDYDDFVYRMKQLESIYAYKKKIVGLGNLCRIMNPCLYLDKVFGYIIQNKEKFYWIHIYGFSLKNIKKYIPLLKMYAPNIKLSVDSTKWTRACTNELKLQEGLKSKKVNRDLFFLEYMKQITKKTGKVYF